MGKNDFAKERKGGKKKSGETKRRGGRVYWNSFKRDVGGKKQEMQSRGDRRSGRKKRQIGRPQERNL